jgi:hypothetical protein
MRRFLMLFFLLLSVNCFAQRELTVESADSVSRILYESQKWKELTRFGQRALDAGIESYLLRVRIGMAFYELEDYANVIPHLRKAVETGYSDGIVKGHLYESYLKMGREEDANDVFFDMSDNRQSRIKPLVNDFIYDAAGRFAFSFSDDDSKNSNIDLDGQDNIYGEQTILGDQIYFDIGISQLPLRWLKISYSFSYVNSDREKQFMFNNEKFSGNYTQKQGQLFNEFNFRAAEGFVIKPSGHYVNTKETQPFAYIDSVAFRDHLNSISNDSRGTSYGIKDSVIEQDDFVLSITALKWFSIFRAGLSGSFSYLNGQHQTQYGASLAVFPLSKPYLCLAADAVVHNQNSLSNFVFIPSVAARLTEDLWLQGSASFGRIRNYNEMNGFIVYNNPDVITLKYAAELKYSFPFNLTASLAYSGEQREKKYLTYSRRSAQEYEPQHIVADYGWNTIIAGLKYEF